jgi:hypothetical protein
MVKNVDYHIIEIEEHPMTFCETLHPHRLDPSLSQGCFNVLGKGLDVPSGTAGTDDKIISITYNFTYFTDQRFLRLVSSRHLSA